MSKGDRSVLSDSVEYHEMMQSYAQDQCDLYDWYYPEELNDVPADYAERKLFWNGTLGICPYNSTAKSKYRITPGWSVKDDVYGNALFWQPASVDPNSTMYHGQRWAEHRFPLLRLAYCPAELIKDYVKGRYSALISAGQNTIAMRQPIALAGVQGVGLKYVGDMITQGDSYVPMLSADEEHPTKDATVLDLGAQNFLDPLTGFIDACDGWASRMIGTDSASTQKASGISIEEVTAGDKRVKARRMNGLKQRRDWCDRVADALDIEIEVYLNDEYVPRMDGSLIADGVDSDIHNDPLSADDAGKKKSKET